MFNLVSVTSRAREEMKKKRKENKQKQSQEEEDPSTRRVRCTALHGEVDIFDAFNLMSVRGRTR